MEETVDLGAIADRLAEKFPSIKALYIFGSRAFGTGSPRSDIDILIEYEGHIRPAELRAFADEECKALDLFLVAGGKATSSQNESYIDAKDFNSLIGRLDAVKFWERNAGRMQIDVPWRQTFRSDVNFIPSALPQRPDSPLSLDVGTLNLGQLFGLLTVKQAWGIGVAIVTLMVSIFGAGYWLGENTLVENNASAEEATVESAD